MSYLALYRKYRPTSFSSLEGQENVKKILTSAVINNKISHAYLFYGPRGTGKTTTAKILAKMVNCLDIQNGEPCGKCKICKNILNSNDIIEIDAASNNGVDEIRNLREKATLVPSMSRYKVYIIDEVHMLTTQAFNALLKILEEPPKHVIFILATTEFYKIPLTITSRCQKFQFFKLTDDELVNKLREISKNENINISDDALSLIAKVSDGGMRDSINLLDQLRSSNNSDIINITDVYKLSGTISNDIFFKLFNSIINADFLNVLDIFEEIDKNGKDFSRFFEEFIIYLKDLILFKNNISDKYFNYEYKSISKISELYNIDQLYYILSEVNILIDRIRNISRKKDFIVANFLLLINNVSCSNNKNNHEIFDYTESNMKSEIELNNTLNNKNKLDNTNNDLINENNNFAFINRDIFINNAFVSANKELKNDLENKFKSLSNYLTDKRYNDIVSLLMDVQLQVAGQDYLIFSVNYDELVDRIYNKYTECKNFIDMFFECKYNISFITYNEWLNLKNEFVLNLKNGKKYYFQSIKNKSDIRENKENFSTEVDRLFELVGEENIIYK